MPVGQSGNNHLILPLGAGVVQMADKEKIGECVVPYLNRLGDALFVLARWANQMRRGKETVWKK